MRQESSVIAATAATPAATAAASTATAAITAATAATAIKFMIFATLCRYEPVISNSLTRKLTTTL